MNRPWHLVLLLVLAAALPAQVVARAEAPWKDPNGFTPVLVHLESDVPLTVRVEARLDQARTQADAQAPGRITLLLPTGPSGHSLITVQVLAPGQAPQKLEISPLHEPSSVDVLVIDDTDVVTELRAVVTALKPSLAQGHRFSSTYGGTYDVGQRVVSLDPQYLPDRWQALPDWVGIAVSPDGERRLTPGQRAALTAWSQAGGRLLLTDATQITPWRSLGAQVRPAGPSELQDLLTLLAERYDFSPSPLPIPGLTGVPVGLFVTVALLFTLVAGPINLWVFGRTDRSRLLITTPLISAGTCLVLLIGGVWSEGLGTRRAGAQLMVVDPQAHVATTWTSVTIYAGLAPGAMTLDPADRLRGHQREDYAWTWGQGTSGRHLDQRQGLVAVSGWIPARTPRSLALTTVRPERRRLQATAHQITNGFDQTLEEVWMRRDQRWFTATAVAPGATAAWTASDHGPEVPDHRTFGPEAPALDTGDLLARLAGPVLPLPGPDGEGDPISTWILQTLPPHGQDGF